MPFSCAFISPLHTPHILALSKPVCYILNVVYKKNFSYSIVHTFLNFFKEMLGNQRMVLLLSFFLKLQKVENVNIYTAKILNSHPLETFSVCLSPELLLRQKNIFLASKD